MSVKNLVDNVFRTFWARKNWHKARVIGFNVQQVIILELPWPQIRSQIELRIDAKWGRSLPVVCPIRGTNMVRAHSEIPYKPPVDIWTPHTYLDGINSFMYLSLWAMGTFHSTATLSIQRVPMVCMGSGSCTVSIFSSPASATLAGQAFFFAFIPF